MRKNDSSCAIVLVRSKKDLELGKKELVAMREKVLVFCRKYRTLYFETSAKSGEGVKDCFERSLELVYHIHNFEQNFDKD